MSKMMNKYFVEVCECVVCMVLDNVGQYESCWLVILLIFLKIGCVFQMLNEWVKKVEVDCGDCVGVMIEMVERMKVLECENCELK